MWTREASRGPTCWSGHGWVRFPWLWLECGCKLEDLDAVEVALEDLQIWPREWTRGSALEVGEGGKGTDSAQLAAQQLPDLLRVSPVARGEDRIARQALLCRCARRRCPLRCRVILIPPNVGRAAPLGRRVVLTPRCIIEWRHVTLPVLLLKLALLLLPGQPPHSFRG